MKLIAPGEASAREKENVPAPIALFTAATVGALAVESATGQNFFDGDDQVASGLGLQNVPLSARGAHVGTDTIGVMHGENQNLRGQPLGANLGGEFQAAGTRHSYIQNDEIRSECRDGLQSFGGIRCFADDFPFGPEFGEQSAHTLADNLMIVDDENFWLSHFS